MLTDTYVTSKMNRVMSRLLSIAYAPHQLKFAVRWDKADGTSRIKVVQPHALMEPTIVKLDSVPDPSVAFVNDKLVVEAKFTFRCP